MFTPTPLHLLTCTPVHPHTCTPVHPHTCSPVHTHIWQEDDAYYILVVSRDTAVAAALQELAQLEAHCEAHQQLIPEFSDDDEGFLFIARGEKAFIYARLFLALEDEEDVGVNG